MFDKIFSGLWQMIKVYDLTSITSLFSKGEIFHLIKICYSPNFFTYIFFLTFIQFSLPMRLYSVTYIDRESTANVMKYLEFEQEKYIPISVAIRHIKLKFLYVNNISTKEYILNSNCPKGSACLSMKTVKVSDYDVRKN